MSGGEGPAGRGAYHHGDLRQAMIAAAEAVLAEKGIGGFTLRECARRAGVSPAAPAHHFGNLEGLLTAIATLGFDDLSNAMEAAAESADAQGQSRLAAIARAYLATALANPGRFRVVFGQRRGDRHEPGFQAAAARAFGILVRETRAHMGAGEIAPGDPKELAGNRELGPILLAWSVTHGFSTLLIDGQIDFLGGDAGREALIALYSGELVGLLVAGLGRLDGLAIAGRDG